MVFQSCSFSYTQSFTFGFDRSRDRPIFHQNDVKMVDENVNYTIGKLAHGIKHNLLLWENCEDLSVETRRVIIDNIQSDIILLLAYVNGIKQETDDLED